METLGKVLDGELAWDQHTHRADDIVTAIRRSEELGYRLVVNHGTEGHLVADTLAERDIPGIFGPILTSRLKVELRHRALRAPGMFTTTTSPRATASSPNAATRNSDEGRGVRSRLP